MNYYKKDGSYIVSDLELALQKVTAQEYLAWKNKQDTIADLKRQLSDIDEKSARSMRAILAETATQEDKDFLANLESQADLLRKQIHDLEVGK